MSIWRTSRAHLDGWCRAAAGLPHRWSRVLLAVLGCCQLLMAASARPLAGVVGLAGGAALIAASLLPSTRRRMIVVLVVIGTVPFAVLAWTALVPVVVGVVAAALAMVVHHGRPAIPISPPATEAAR